MKALHFSVLISAKAEQDLRTLADYVMRERSLDDAVELIDSIRGKIESLEQFPSRGAIPVEIRALGVVDYRQIIVGPYRIFYLVGNIEVTITMIADGRRDIASLLRQGLTTV